MFFFLISILYTLLHRENRGGELCKNVPEWYLQADYEKKRELLKLLHSNFLYDGEKPHFELNSVFRLMLELPKNEKNVDGGT